MSNRKKSEAGFTLVELSIVILIIGLLITGVAAGTNMIRQAELRSIISDFFNNTIAYNNFVTKYKQVPGDMVGAGAYFGDANCAVSGMTCSSTASTAGNGIVDYTTSAATSEINRAWKHMELGQTLGLGFSLVPNSILTTISSNAPASKRAGTGYIIVGGNDVSASIFSANSNVIYIGKQAATTSLFNGALTPSDAYGIDAKMDDGHFDATTSAFLGAGSGTVRVKDGSDATTGDCVTSPGTAGATYTDLNSNNTSCRLGYQMS